MRLKFFISFIGLLLAQVFFVVAHAQTLPIPPTILNPFTEIWKNSKMKFPAKAKSTMIMKAVSTPLNAILCTSL